MQIIAMVAGLLFCAVVLILNSLVRLVFGSITATVIKGVSWQRRLAMSARSALPFACLALIVVPFILEGVIVKKVSTPGSCRLPNGYSLMMIDEASPAWIYNPKNESTRGSVLWQKDGVDGVKTLQVANRYILGGRDSHGLTRLAKTSEEVDSYFVLDTAVICATPKHRLRTWHSVEARPCEYGLFKLRVDAILVSPRQLLQHLDVRRESGYRLCAYRRKLHFTPILGS